jgi:hypothetical protein
MHVYSRFGEDVYQFTDELRFVCTRSLLAASGTIKEMEMAYQKEGWENETPFKF